MNSEELYEKLLAAAFRFVSYRPRSEKEIREFLAKKLARRHTTAPLVLQKVLDRLDELGYIDDERFARWWLEQRAHFRPKGKRVLRQELRAKGISPELIEKLLAAESSQNKSYSIQNSYILDEREMAKKAVGKKIALWEKLPILARKKKIYDFLVRRGFTSETAFAVIDELVGKE